MRLLFIFFAICLVFPGFVHSKRKTNTGFKSRLLNKKLPLCIKRCGSKQKIMLFSYKNCLCKTKMWQGVPVEDLDADHYDSN